MTFRALFGRSRELADLEAALDRAIGGRGSAFLLSGEPGVGKTRLAEELAEVARRRGATVFWGRAWEVEGAPACWPWVQVLRGCAQTSAGRTFLDEDVLGAALAPLLRASAGPDEPELDFLRLADAIAALLRRLSGAGPIVLVFDDLHASDVASLDLLQRAARDLRDLRVLVLGTYRDVEARRTPRLATLLARLAREGTARPLGPLDPSSVAQWLEGALGVAPTPALTEAVFSATEGNPLFVEALSQLLASRGQGASPPLGVALPDTVRETIEERLARVPPELRDVLEAASVLGRECQVAMLQLVCDRPVEQMLAALTEGVAAGVLSPQALPSSPVRFAHVLVREAVYQALPVARRIELHARCASALKRLPASDLDAHLAELAHHCFESAPVGSWLEAADFSTRAADRAMELLAFDDAARHLERALAALDHAGGGDDGHRAELLWRLGTSQMRVGHGKLGRNTCARAAALAERAGKTETYARAALAYGSEIVPGRVEPRLVELLETALRLGPGNEALRAEVMARLAAAMMPTLAPERPHELARQAIADARALGDRRGLAQVLSTARAVFTPADDLDERMALDRELAALAASLGDRLLEVQAHGRLAILAVEQGDPDAVELQLRIQRELSDRTRVPQYQLRAACTRLMWATLRARAEDVARAEREVREISERVDDLRGLAILEANRHARARLRGDDAEASAALAAVETLLAPDPSAAWWLPVRRAAALVDVGRLDEARAELLRFAPEGPMRTLSAMGPALLALVLPICLHLGNREWLQSMYQRLLPLRARHAVNLGLLVGDGPVAYHLGCLAAALAQTAEAARHFREAVAVCQRCDFAGLEARAQRALEALGRPAVSLAPAEPPPQLRQDGELWTFSYEGRQARLRDSKGLHYLAAMLRDPGREFHVSELVALPAGATPASEAELRDSGLRSDGLGDAGELLDARAKAAYRRRLEQLEDALGDAEERGDGARAARLEEERGALAAELARAVGLGGRGRRASSASERARINVQRRIRDVLARVSQLDPPLGRHLELHVKTGVFCSWRP